VIAGRLASVAISTGDVSRGIIFAQVARAQDSIKLHLSMRFINELDSKARMITRDIR
jgi:hypothetical protein